MLKSYLSLFLFMWGNGVEEFIYSKTTDNEKVRLKVKLQTKGLQIYSKKTPSKPMKLIYTPQYSQW